MNITAFLSIIVAIVGLIMWFIASNGKVQEAGKLSFFAGLLVFLFVMAKQVINLDL
jgi:hypothetical protein